MTQILEDAKPATDLIADGALTAAFYFICKFYGPDTSGFCAPEWQGEFLNQILTQF